MTMVSKIFIDESGETGISKVRSGKKSGASPYFVMAAAVMPEAATINARQVLKDAMATIPKKWKHATDLNHSQTVYLAREMAKPNLRFFAVVSNKATLGDYANMIEFEPHKFYNKCAVYLLERIGKYLMAKGLEDEVPEVCFEKRNHDYDAMRRFIGKIKDNPLHEDAKYLQVFNPFAISAREKHEEELLKYADIAAHAVYQCANKSEANFGIPEPRYLEELAPKFGVDMSGKILGTGLKCIHSIEQLKLDMDVTRKLKALRAAPFRK